MGSRHVGWQDGLLQFVTCSPKHLLGGQRRISEIVNQEAMLLFHQGGGGGAGALDQRTRVHPGKRLKNSLGWE